MLAQSGDAKARELLLLRLASGGTAEARLVVASALWRLGEPSGRTYLQEQAKKPGPEQLKAAQSLAALARASGIPARVVNGLAFAPSFAGYERAFIPHAWVQAYVDGEWHGYDAALLGFDAGHIALSYGSGESSGFYASVTLFGNLKVLDAQPLPASP